MNSAQNNARIEELLQEDQNAKRRRVRFQKQASLLSKLTRQLGIHDNSAGGFSDSGGGTPESSPRAGHPGDDWRSAFDAAASNGGLDGSTSHRESTRSSSAGSRRSGEPSQNGDASRRTPNRLPPAPPGSSPSMYKY